MSEKPQWKIDIDNAIKSFTGKDAAYAHLSNEKEAHEFVQKCISPCLKEVAEHLKEQEYKVILIDEKENVVSSPLISTLSVSIESEYSFTIQIVLHFGESSSIYCTIGSSARPYRQAQIYPDPIATNQGYDEVSAKIKDAISYLIRKCQPG